MTNQRRWCDGSSEFRVKRVLDESSPRLNQNMNWRHHNNDLDNVELVVEHPDHTDNQKFAGGELGGGGKGKNRETRENGFLSRWRPAQQN